MPKLVEVLFDRYIQNVYKGQVLQPDQFQELRKCFFAAVWGTIHEIGEVSSKLPEPQAVQVFESMTQECRKMADDEIKRWYNLN